MNYKEKDLPISSIELNKGQVAGLPKNPRFIRDERYKALVKSIKDAPEMLHLRELLVYQHGDKYVVIGGNMRLRACKELGMESVPCKILSPDTPVEKLREYTIKDNNGFGQDDWDLLANEWEAEELTDWGLDTPSDWGENFDPSLLQIDTLERQGESPTGLSAITLLFKIEDAERVNDWIKKNSKDELTKKIVELCQSAEAK